MITIPDKSPSAAVLLDAVSFNYGSLAVLDRFSLQIPAGQLVALLGPNGSGKSSILNLVAGISRPDSGAVRRSDAPIALVPQRSAVSDTLPITVRDTVQMGRWGARKGLRPLNHADKRFAAEQMERLGLADLAGRPLSDLSGGQRQRALIAQALCQRAPVLLLDEPEAGLDSEAQSIIRSVLAEESASGVTVIIATHDLATAETTDRCVLLRGNAGGIAADGPPASVLSEPVLAQAFMPS